jgi:CubicO group peptidase (beta-lactamase class C family)
MSSVSIKCAVSLAAYTENTGHGNLTWAGLGIAGLNWYDAAQADGGGAWADQEPGSQYNYSNFATGYRRSGGACYYTGEPFPNFCRDNIFEPLGMNHTAWFFEDLPEHLVEAFPVIYDNTTGTFFAH